MIKYDADEIVSIHIASMSRIIFKRDSGIMSIAFPFCISSIDGQPEISLRGNDVVLNSANTSLAISQYLNGPIDLEGDDGYLSNQLEDAISIISTLENYEDGYVRFDKDEINQNAEAHPLCHFDFYYTESAAIKIGFDLDPEVNLFREFMDASKPRYYARK